MKPHSLPVSAAVGAVLLLALAAPALAVPFDNAPKILVHLRPVTTKNQCAAAQLADCQAAVTEGTTNGLYFAYVLAARGNLPGVAALQFGIRYETGCPVDRLDGEGIDIFSWTLCATLEFATPSPAWPAPNSGNLIVWDAVNACRTGEVGVAGWFYLTNYNGTDYLDIVPRPVDGLAKVANCSSVETTLPTSSLGRAAFSVGGLVAGCNPCAGGCSPSSLPTTCMPPPDVTPPNAVNDLAVIGTDGTSVTLQWHITGDDANNGQASGIDMRYSTSPITEGNFNSATGVFPATPPGVPGSLQQRTVSNLSSNTTFYFAMKVRDEVPNISGLSNVASGTTGPPPPPDVTPPAAVANLTVINQTSSTLTVRWTAPGDDGAGGGAAALYMIRWSTSPIDDTNFGSATPVNPAPPNPGTPGALQSTIVGGLSPSTTYYVAMKTADEVPNISALSNVAAGTTAGAPGDLIAPAMTTTLSVTDFTYNSIQLHWIAPGDDGNTGTATLYDVRWSHAPITSIADFNAATLVSGEPAPLPAGSHTVFNVTGLSANHTYYLALRTQDEAGNTSPLSNVASHTIPIVPPEANGNTVLLIHLAAVQPSPCNALASFDCRSALTRGDLSPAVYNAYLMAGYFAEIAGIECGITYDNGLAGGLDDHDQIDVFSWTLCADLEFASQAPAWPAPGSGTLLTWSTAHCQNGPVAIGGYFYMTAYGPDELRVTPRPATGLGKVATCNSAESVISQFHYGTAAFSAGASLAGFNPCAGAPNPIQPTSWSRIKLLTGPAARPVTRN